jgi:hypothetical protein
LDILVRLPFVFLVLFAVLFLRDPNRRTNDEGDYQETDDPNYTISAEGASNEGKF